MAVIDASVQVALVNAADPHHAAALAWYRDTLVAEEALHAPWILLAEVAAALSRGLGDAALANCAVKHLLDDHRVQLVARRCTSRCRRRHCRRAPDPRV